MNSLFCHRIQEKNISFKHARGSSARSGKEFHIYHELILFLDGDADFISEDLHMHVKPQTLIVIPKETYHQMVIHGDPERYHRCVLQFDEMDEYAMPAENSTRNVLAVEADREIQYLFQKLIRAAKPENANSSQILKAVLVLLLDAIMLKKELSGEGVPQSQIVRTAVAHINQNLGQSLTVGEIAQACNTSASALAHVFKKEMYCSVHKFILKKRLIFAHHRITAGEAATVVAVECGFRDYSGFYKQYKKAFGVAPSQRK